MAEWEKDKKDARSALRTASWGMMFYLVSLANPPFCVQGLMRDYHGCDWTFQCSIRHFPIGFCGRYHALCVGDGTSSQC